MIRTKKIVCILIAVCMLIVITGKQAPGNAAYAQELPKDGTYSIPVHLWNATKDAASLGNDALEQTAKLVIDKGECRLYVKLKGISMMGLQGYLMQLDILKNIQWNENGYPIQYEYKDTTVVSRYAVVDLYNGKDSTDDICRGKYYPKAAALDVTYGETYTWAHIYVPVMGSMGFGDQLCRIKLDYDQMKEMTQQEKEVWEEAQKDEVTPEATPDIVPSPDKTSAPISSVTPSAAADGLTSPTPSGQNNANTPMPSAQNNTNTPSDSGNTALDKNNLANGTYSLDVSLWKETVDQLSMGNPALQTMALLTVKDGTKRLQIGTRLMTFGTITAGLHSFQVKQKDGSYRYANVDASENILDGKAIPSLFSFDLPDTSEYLAVKIDPRVAIMNNQIMDARLKLDWSTLRKVADDTQIEKEDATQTQATAKTDKKTTQKKSTSSSKKAKTSQKKKSTTAATRSTKKTTTASNQFTENASEDVVSDYDIEQDEEELLSDGSDKAGDEEDMLSSEMNSEGGESIANASDEADQESTQNSPNHSDSQDAADQKKEQSFLTAFGLGGSMLLSVINVFFVCTCIWMQFYKKRKED